MISFCRATARCCPGRLRRSSVALGFKYRHGRPVLEQMLAHPLVEGPDVQPAHGLGEIEDVEPLHREPEHHEGDAIRTVERAQVAAEALAAGALDVALVESSFGRALDLLADLLR